MKKHAFVPDALGRLEDRVVLSGVRFATSGAAILTTSAFNHASGGINNAFSRFATRGMNYGRLAADLTNALKVIPYVRADGLAGEIQGEVQQMAANINAGQVGAVKAALVASQRDLRSFVMQEVANGRIVIR
jgi:hypothetical protein